MKSHSKILLKNIEIKRYPEERIKAFVKIEKEKTKILEEAVFPLKVEPRLILPPSHQKGGSLQHNTVTQAVQGQTHRTAPTPPSPLTLHYIYIFSI